MSQLKLLTDEQVQQFIANGYLTVRADYRPSFHEGVRRQIDEVFEDPAVAGALTSASTLSPQPARQQRPEVAQGLLRLRRHLSAELDYQ